MIYKVIVKIYHKFYGLTIIRDDERAKVIKSWKCLQIIKLFLQYLNFL
jgi:hypothetical protein